MTVTSGFYVRSLCHDLGVAVGSAALMAELKRTRQGDFEVGKNCLEYEDLEKGEGVWGKKVESALDGWYEAHKEKDSKDDRTVDMDEVKKEREELNAAEGSAGSSAPPRDRGYGGQGNRGGRGGGGRGGRGGRRNQDNMKREPL